MPNKMNESAKNIQLAFIEKVKRSLPSNISLVEELADLLEVSNDSAYRRMRGETPLTIDEIYRICTRFKTTFETDVQEETSSVTFNFIELFREGSRFIQWLTNLSHDVKHIGQVDDAHIMYAADDVPIWHHYIQDEFIAFKFFYWMKCILNTPEFDGKKFDTASIDPVLIQQAKELLATYNKIKSVEIWTEDTFNSTLKQVEYFWESDYFTDKEQALRMCDHIHEILDIIQAKAAKGNKHPTSNEPNFELYMSDLMVGNNSILVTLGESKVAYVSHNTFNFMSTSNAAFVEENEQWLKNLIRKANLISGVSEKQRNKFFKILHDKVNKLKEKIV